MLAAAFEGDDPFRHAWHLAAATVGPDHKAATALAAVGAECTERGAYAAAAAAFERAARLTPDRDGRSVLLAEAADAAWLAGRTDECEALVAEGLSADPTGVARAELLARRGRMRLHGDEQEAAYDTLLEAALLLETEDPARAAELLADAVGAAIQLAGDRAAAAAGRLRVLPAHHDPMRELLAAQGLLAATSVAGDPGGRDRLEQAPRTPCGSREGGSCSDTTTPQRDWHAARWTRRDAPRRSA